MKKITLLHCLLICLWVKVNAETTHVLRSPDNRIELKIVAGDRIRYSISLNGKALLQDCALSLAVDQRTLGVDPKIRNVKRRTVSQEIEPQVRQKSARIREDYNELRLEMEGDYLVVFRAYNEGAAYRFETSIPQTEVKVRNEEASFNFAGDYHVYFPKEESFFSHNEREFVYLLVKDIPSSSMASVPAVVEANDGTKIAICDADVDDYPGMWLRGSSKNSIEAVFPPYPLKEQLIRDRDLKISEAADFIAATKGTRAYPWRAIGIAANDGDLIVNQLVYLLARASQVQDASWIKPGKVAWDWYKRK
jgi:alpha-glucosidase